MPNTSNWSSFIKTLLIPSWFFSITEAFKVPTGERLSLKNVMRKVPSFPTSVLDLKKLPSLSDLSKNYSCQTLWNSISTASATVTFEGTGVDNSSGDPESTIEGEESSRGLFDKCQNFAAYQSLLDTYSPLQSKLIDIWDQNATAFWQNWHVNVDESTGTKSLKSSLEATQVQLPLMQRVAKSIHQESMAWLVSIMIPLVFSVITQSTMPIIAYGITEVSFFVYIVFKLIFMYDKPNTPQPLLKDRSWEYVCEHVWSSQESLDDKRGFLMGWFFDAPFERLRYEDAVSYLAWMRYGTTLEALNEDQSNELLHYDMHKLQEEVNDGRPLPRRAKNEEILPCMRFTIEQIRFRHKPLVFYGVTHGARAMLNGSLEKLGFTYTPAPDCKTSLGYWYRPKKVIKGRTFQASETTEPLVFIHGVGGMAFYYSVIESLAERIDSEIVLLDLPYVSLNLCDDVPSIDNQVKSVCTTLDQTFGPNKKATFVGHSFGTIMESWMVQAAPERVANCIFLDPVCFQLHLKDILFKFHYQRADKAKQAGIEWESPMTPAALTNMAGTEIHTNMSMFRHFSWASNELWPEDLTKNGISSTIFLSEHDEIVPSREVDQLVTSFNEKKIKVTSGKNTDWVEFLKERSDCFVKSEIVKDACHGQFVFDDKLRNQVVDEVVNMVKINSVKKTRVDPFATVVDHVPLWSSVANSDLPLDLSGVFSSMTFVN